VGLVALSPERAKCESPGQRPGSRVAIARQALKGRNLAAACPSRPFRASNVAAHSSPGRCPGLSSSAPSGHLQRGQGIGNANRIPGLVSVRAATVGPKAQPFSQPWATPRGNETPRSSNRPNGPTVLRREPLARWADNHQSALSETQGDAQGWANYAPSGQIRRRTLPLRRSRNRLASL
jgi:hypothetical protein